MQPRSRSLNEYSHEGASTRSPHARQRVKKGVHEGKRVREWTKKKSPSAAVCLLFLYVPRFSERMQIGDTSARE